MMRGPEECEIARAVLARLNERGLEIKEACRRAGVPYGVVGHWLRGTRTIRLCHLAPLLRVLGLVTVRMEMVNGQGSIAHRQASPHRHAGR